MKRRTPAKIEKKVDEVSARIQKKIADQTGTGKYERGLANEGYLGGYLQALSDVDAFIRGMMPSNWNTKEFWKEDA